MKRTTSEAAPSTKTRTVAGHRLALVTGIRYRASRPMAARGMKTFNVTIAPIDGAEALSVVVPGLEYDASNRLLNAFNNGAMSFDGRVW